MTDLQTAAEELRNEILECLGPDGWTGGYYKEIDAIIRRAMEKVAEGQHEQMKQMLGDIEAMKEDYEAELAAAKECLTEALGEEDTDGAPQIRKRYPGCWCRQCKSAVDHDTGYCTNHACWRYTARQLLSPIEPSPPPSE